MTSLAADLPIARARVARIPSPAERAAELHAFEKQAERDRLVDLARSCAEFFAWSAAGLACIGWSFHTSDVGWGMIAFYGGLVIGNGGILVTLVCANQRAARRGDIL